MRIRPRKALLLVNLVLLVLALLLPIALAFKSRPAQELRAMLGSRSSIEQASDAKVLRQKLIETHDRLSSVEQEATALRATLVIGSVVVLLGAVFNLGLLRWPASEDAGRATAVSSHRSDVPAHNLTPRARQVLALARKEAVRLHHNFVGTEHVLLGLVGLGQGVACKVLQNLVVDLEALRREVEKQVGIGSDAPAEIIPYTPRVKKVLALASREAQALNHTYVGTEHLFLGLLGEGEGVAARVLTSLGVDLAKARRAILDELDPNAK
jgi:hypothetical protein